MDELCLVDNEKEEVLPDTGALDLIPFHGHAFPRIELHDDLLTVYFVRESFKKHLSLVQLGDTIKLDPPEQQVQCSSNKGPDEPPDTGNQEVAGTDCEDYQRHPPLLPEYAPKSK